MPFESFLANETAEMVGFALVSNFEFSSFLVKNHAANWISKRHYCFKCLMHDSTFCLLWLMVDKPKIAVIRTLETKLYQNLIFLTVKSSKFTT